MQSITATPKPQSQTEPQTQAISTPTTSALDAVVASICRDARYQSRLYVTRCNTGLDGE
ncbi:hypothetical protein RMSM_05272 [Rhodopirellula maiorica SM1]|uniref:Uncharacterized protein n=1 Tax=Rhodopirellula maiorica SM1 TaxID=1265738 RepID=M5REL0_9BACT|nr:hypothetical protein [Rhodopirellula maiorica]EMI17795.1 hypothetical protein RMSM_05272 [Rhodopirellula maiorica SM1]